MRHSTPLKFLTKTCCLIYNITTVKNRAQKPANPQKFGSKRITVSSFALCVIFLTIFSTRRNYCCTTNQSLQISLSIEFQGQNNIIPRTAMSKKRAEHLLLELKVSKTYNFSNKALPIHISLLYKPTTTKVWIST